MASICYYQALLNSISGIINCKKEDSLSYCTEYTHGIYLYDSIY